ncbi:MAG: hypothetical protein Q8M02_10245 [Candidatus Didemnitutus sp.]|nr:hypothetical protein [Candidatus Didemnitutus sp.]
MHQNPLDILFGGTSVTVELIDGTKQSVYVRALPQRHLHHVISTYEHRHLFIELCTYTKLTTTKIPAEIPQEIPPPTGFCPVPVGWADNVCDGSIEDLFQKAEELNFQRAVTWARAQITAKKQISPLVQEMTSMVMPIVERVMQPLFARLEQLSISTPSAPKSSDSPASSS